MSMLMARDERERAVDHAADRLSFLVVAYGALLLAAYRSLVLEQASWELLGLVVVGGAVGFGYRVLNGAVDRRYSLVLLAAVAGAALVAAAFVWLGFANP